MPTAIIGYTGSGKSRMFREAILPRWHGQRIAAVILDPVGQAWAKGHLGRPPWTWQTRDPYLWIEKVKQVKNCVLMMDETALHVGLGGKVARDLAYAPCTSRNDGNFLYMLGQRTLHLPPSYRSQVSEAFLFWQPEISEAEEAASMAGLARSYGKLINQLPMGQCYHCVPRKEPKLLKVF